MCKSHDFKLFDGFSWFLGNVKISWFSNTLKVFHDFWAMWKSHDFLYFLTVFHDFWAMWISDDFLYFLTVFHDFWAMWKSHDFQTFWRFFMISGQCENLIAFMIFKHWRFFMISGQCENLMIFLILFDGFSWFLGNVKISWFSNFLTVFHDFWAMWKSDDFFYTFWRFFMISGQCKNLIAFMIFKHFDGFSWFLGNVKISWFSDTLTVFHDFWAM
jgi:hypothetical protein